MKLMTKFLTGVLVVGGLSVGVYTMNDHNFVAAKTNELVQTVSTQTTTSTKTISVEKAKEIALEAAKGGQVRSVHLGEEYGQKEYGIEITNQGIEYEIDLDATTGKVLRMDQDLQDTDADEGNDELQNVSPKISLEEAKKLALTKVKGTVVEVNVDHDYQLVYEVEINTNDYREAEVKVDALTGDILTVEMDD